MKKSPKVGPHEGELTLLSSRRGPYPVSQRHVKKTRGPASTQQEILDADKLEVPGNRRGKVKRQGGRDRLGWTEGRGTGTPAEPVTSDVSL